MDSAGISIVIAGVVVATAFGGLLGMEVFDSRPSTARGAPESLSTATPDAGADEELLRNGVAGDPVESTDPESGSSHASRAGMLRPQFPTATGSVPTPEEASELEQVPILKIVGDAAFTPAKGVRSGSGSLDDPYIISGFYVTGDLYVQDTEACFVVRENYIGGQLSLNWNGQCTHVHHNFIRDLRVNENIARVGYVTGGLLELNKIEVIGQLRHYDGEFRQNVVGPMTTESLQDPVQETAPYLYDEDPRVANIDGFNQGLIHHNTFYGSVDLDFHGHHHGSGFFAPHSHYHGSNESYQMPHDHTNRWTSVAFDDNKIVDPEGYGLRYDDRQHAADDRTAKSETIDELELEHIHYTDIQIARNRVEDAGIWVDVFNADDKRHYRTNPGTFDLSYNSVALTERRAEGPLDQPVFGPDYRPNAALRVLVAKEVATTIIGNQLSYGPAEAGSPLDGPMGPEQIEPIAIDLWHLRNATITIEDNTATGFDYGVKAQKMDDLTHWYLSNNDFGDAAWPVWYDESVANRPGE